jgi:hypothetical protein
VQFSRTFSFGAAGCAAAWAPHGVVRIGVALQEVPSQQRQILHSSKPLSARLGMRFGCHDLTMKLHIFSSRQTVNGGQHFCCPIADLGSADNDKHMLHLWVLVIAHARMPVSKDAHPHMCLSTHTYTCTHPHPRTLHCWAQTGLWCPLGHLNTALLLVLRHL